MVGSNEQPLDYSSNAFPTELRTKYSMYFHIFIRDKYKYFSVSRMNYDLIACRNLKPNYIFNYNSFR